MLPKSHLARAALCLFLLLSPVGAPLIGASIGFCEPDQLFVPTGPFALGFSYCGFNRPIEQLYQRTTVLPFLAMALVGPFFGSFISVAWWLAAIGSAIGFVWFLVRAIASVTIEKL